jgi:hypothetical protein
VLERREREGEREADRESEGESERGEYLCTIGRVALVEEEEERNVLEQRCADVRLEGLKPRLREIDNIPERSYSTKREREREREKKEK